MSTSLADRVAVLRDEVLDTAHAGDDDDAAAAVFAAIVRHVESSGETTPGIDLALHDAVRRRILWGDSERDVLAGSAAVMERLLRATPRAFRDPMEELLVIEAAAETCAAVGRIVTLTACARAGRERVAQVREELDEARLSDELGRQRAELARLEAAALSARRKIADPDAP